MKNKPLQALVLVSTLGFQFAFTVALGFFIGNYLDQRLNSGQLMMIIGVFLGIAAGFFGAYKLIKPFLEDD